MIGLASDLTAPIDCPCRLDFDISLNFEVYTFFVNKKIYYEFIYMDDVVGHTILSSNCNTV